MPDIILQILSWLGIILLALLVIALLLILLVLFFPISYRISAKKQLKEIQVSAKAKWLFGILRVNYMYPEPGNLMAKFLWFKIFDSSEKPAEKTKPTTAGEKECKNSKADSETQKGKLKNVTENPKADKTAESTKTAPKAAPRSETNFLGKVNKIKYTFRNICDKIKMIWENISYYLELLQEENTRELFSHICLRVGRILKNIRPGRIEADILAGTGSPDTTGYLYGIYWMVFPNQGPKVLVTPDFEQAVLEGNLSIAGHITVAVLLVNGLKIALDKKLHLFLEKIKAAPGMQKEPQDSNE